MVIDAGVLLDHLGRICCRGLVSKVVLEGAFGATALTSGDSLLVIAPPLRGVEPLIGPVGVTDLELVIKALRQLDDPLVDQVGVIVTEGGRELVLKSELRGEIRCRTRSPDMIETAIQPGNAERILEGVEDREMVHLGQNFTEVVRDQIKLLQAELVALQVRSSGTEVIVYGGKNHRASVGVFPYEALNDPDGYDVCLSAQQFGRILGNVFDFTDSGISVGGPNELVEVRCCDYRYLLNPREVQGREVTA